VPDEGGDTARLDAQDHLLRALAVTRVEAGIQTIIGLLDQDG
jgi:hypothetical protein